LSFVVAKQAGKFLRALHEILDQLNHEEEAVKRKLNDAIDLYGSIHLLGMTKLTQKVAIGFYYVFIQPNIFRSAFKVNFLKNLTEIC
jgi:hypothetical protein